MCWTQGGKDKISGQPLKPRKKTVAQVRRGGSHLHNGSKRGSGDPIKGLQKKPRKTKQPIKKKSPYRPKENERACKRGTGTKARTFVEGEEKRGEKVFNRADAHSTEKKANWKKNEQGSRGVRAEWKESKPNAAGQFGKGLEKRKGS